MGEVPGDHIPFEVGIGRYRDQDAQGQKATYDPGDVFEGASTPEPWLERWVHPTHCGFTSLTNEFQHGVPLVELCFGDGACLEAPIREGLLVFRGCQGRTGSLSAGPGSAASPFSGRWRSGRSSRCPPAGQDRESVRLLLVCPDERNSVVEDAVDPLGGQLRQRFLDVGKRHAVDGRLALGGAGPFEMFGRCFSWALEPLVTAMFLPHRSRC